MALLDANILVYYDDEEAPQHGPSHALVRHALAGLLPALLAPQVLLEYYRVVTHPQRVRVRLAPDAAWEQVTAFRARLPVLEVRPSALDILGDLVATLRPRGPHVFDLYLAAQALSHNVHSLCTYNAADFRGITGLEAVTPEELLARYQL